MFTMRALLFAVALGLTAGLAAAQTEDPFDILFGGEGRLDAGAVDQAGDDDLSLVRLDVRGFEVAGAVSVYRSPAGPCLMFSAVMDALEFPIQETEPGLFEGWFIARGRTAEIDLESKRFVSGGFEGALNPESVRLTPEGWCATPEVFSEIFPLEVVYRSDTLSVSITPTEILPLEARLEREAARDRLAGTQVGQPGDFPELANPYRWLELPVGDITLDLSKSGNDGLTAAVNLDVVGDVLKTTGRLRTVGGSNESFGDSLRFTLGRSSSRPSELGFLKARSFAAGDVSTSSLPLLARSRTGAGFIVTNRSGLSAEMFDTTTLRGPLPQGWEAELYENGQLIAFVTEPDNVGDYVFENVTLRPGFNRFEVRLFGPFGETDVREFKQFVGADLTPENETSYTFGIVHADKPVFGSTNTEITEGETAIAALGSGEDQGVIVQASLSRGLTQRLTARVDGHLGLSGLAQQDSAATLSLFGAYLGGYGVVRLASNGRGQPAIQASAQRRIGGQSSFSASYANFGSFENELTGRGSGRLRRAGQVRIDTALPVRGQLLPFRAEVDWERLADGARRFNATTRIGAALRAVRLTHTLQFSQFSEPAGRQSALRGELLASRSFRGFRLRGALNYGLDDGFGLTNASLTAQRSFGSANVLQASLAHDFASNSPTVNASWSRAFRTFFLSATGGASVSGGWNVGMRLSFSLFRDRQSRRLSIASPGLTRTGALRPLVFEDVNGNGLPDSNERRIEGAKFIVANSLRSVETGTNGQSIIADLPSNTLQNAELQLSSLDDPFLLPVHAGTSFSVRPGQIVDFPVPLKGTGDAEGTLVVHNGDKKLPVAGVTIEFVDRAGLVVETAQTEFDGYFYADGLPLEPLQVRVAPAQVASIAGRSKPVDIVLSPEQPSLFGLDISIQK